MAAQSIVEYLSKQNKPLTDVLTGAIAIAPASGTPVYEGVKPGTGADSGKILINYPAGSRIGIIQSVGYLGQKLFAKIALYTYFNHPFKVAFTIKQVLIPIERLLFEAKPVKVNTLEVYSIGNNVNVRQTASISAKRVELYNKGQLVGSTDGKLFTSTDTLSKKNWYKITTSTGKTGFIREDVVSVNKAVATPIPLPSNNSINQVYPTSDQKASEMDAITVETSHTTLRTGLFYAGIALLLGVGIWLFSNAKQIHGSKKY